MALQTSRPVKTTWRALLAVCSKCDGGRDLRARLKREAKQRGEKGLRIVRTSCLDVCPKRLVAVALASGDRCATFVTEPDATLASLELGPTLP